MVSKQPPAGYQRWKASTTGTPEYKARHGLVKYNSPRPGSRFMISKAVFTARLFLPRTEAVRESDQIPEQPRSWVKIVER